MKILKWVLIILGALIALGFLAMPLLKQQTKKASPEQTIDYNKGDLDISVFYCRPYKKGRTIFGELIPYGKVWRTGANEATTFSTSKDIKVNGQTLAAGLYTLWTIPDKNQWEVIFNSKQYGWGVNFNAEPSRKAEADVLNVKIPVTPINTAHEQFTITVAEGDSVTTHMTLAWDQTSIIIPITE